MYDIGGGYGEYAWWLASPGYEVHLVDLSETSIRMSGELKGEYPGARLAAAELPTPERSPARPLQRTSAPDGAALQHFYGLRPYTGRKNAHHRPNRLLEEEAFMKMIERELCDGGHIRPENSEYTGIGRSHFHAPEELEEEITASGFSGTVLHGVVGAAWLAPGVGRAVEGCEGPRGAYADGAAAGYAKGCDRPVHPSACHIPKRDGRTAFVLFIYAFMPHKCCILLLLPVYE